MSLPKDDTGRQGRAAPSSLMLWSAALSAILLAPACGGSQPAPSAAGDEPMQDPAQEQALLEEPEESWGNADTEQAAAPSENADEAETPETRTTEVLQQVVAEKRASVRACYDKAREKNPALPGGDFILRIVIDPEGAVKSAEHDQARSAVKSTDVAQCAIAEVKTWKFPPSSRGMETKLNYPFNFKP